MYKNIWRSDIFIQELKYLSNYRSSTKICAICGEVCAKSCHPYCIHGPHYFHKECLQQWTSTHGDNTNTNTCPICRRPLNSKRSERILENNINNHNTILQLYRSLFPPPQYPKLKLIVRENFTDENCVSVQSLVNARHRVCFTNDLTTVNDMERTLTLATVSFRINTNGTVDIYDGTVDIYEDVSFWTGYVQELWDGTVLNDDEQWFNTNLWSISESKNHSVMNYSSSSRPILLAI